MNEIQNKLKELKEEVSPDLAFKERSRQILLSQIYASENEAVSTFNWTEEILARLPWQILKSVSQPMLAALLVFGFLGAGSIWSVSAAKETKPGDSLYVAKIISEKAKLAVTFDEKEEAKLRLGFATNRAEEINRVLDEKTSDKNSETVSSLVSDMKEEIEVVKTRIGKINVVARVPVKAKKKVAVKDEETKKGAESDVAVDEESGSQVIGANSGKEVKGISTSDQDKKEIEVKIEKAVPTETAKELLDKAKESLRNEDYNSAIGLLDRIGSVVDKEVTSSDKGEVRGEKASSSTER